MSTYLKVVQFGGGSRLFRLRRLSTILGEDSAGIFSQGRSSLPFFSVHACLDEYYLQAEHPGLNYNNRLVNLQELIPLRTGDVLQIKDYRIIVVVTNGLAEISSTSAILGTSVWPSGAQQTSFAEVYLAGRSRRLPLLRGNFYTVSTEDSASFHLDPEIYGSLKFSLSVNDTEFVVTPERGIINIGETLLTCPTVCRGETQLSLTPLKLPFALRPGLATAILI